MTIGFFTPANEPAIPLEVRGPDGARSFDAIIDTGFNGAPTLPPDWITPVGLPQAGQEPVTLSRPLSGAKSLRSCTTRT